MTSTQQVSSLDQKFLAGELQRNAEMRERYTRFTERRATNKRSNARRQAQQRRQEQQERDRNSGMEL